ncbi:MAG: hypothetical protein ACFCVD_06055, partial [Nodosilinea sp.]
LPLKKLKPNIMTASGSLGSSPCNANYHPGRPPKDVSGSQGTASEHQVYVAIACPPPWERNDMASKGIPAALSTDNSEVRQLVWVNALRSQVGF